MKNKSGTQKPAPSKDKKRPAVRGADLRKQGEESHIEGEKYRARHQGKDAIKPSVPS